MLTRSSRQFCELSINLEDGLYLRSSIRIREIATKFGNRIRKVKFWSPIQWRSSCKVMDTDLLKILKFIPNVEELILYNIFVGSSDRNPTQPLHSHKLTKLNLNYCSFENSTFLDLIPNDVLTDLVFTFDSLDETIYQNFFNHQGQIKKLEMFENSKINFDHLSLEHLKISSGIDFAAMLNHQKTLKYIDFAISWIDGDVFNAVLQLHNLEVLRTLIDQVPCTKFKQLTQLKNLKELRIDSHCSFDCGHLLTLSTMTGMQLEKLTLYCIQQHIPEEILIQISKNFVTLKHIQIANRSIRNLITIAKHFGNVETVLMDFTSMYYEPNVLQIDDDGSKYENLKQVVITNLNTSEVLNTEALLIFCNSCPNLERISLSTLTGVTVNDLVKLFSKHQKLKYLSVDIDCINFDFVDIALVAKFILKLHYFRITKIVSYPKLSVLKGVFQQIFRKIELHEYLTNGAGLTMKRRTVEDWYSSLNIVDHFT